MKTVVVPTPCLTEWVERFCREEGEDILVLGDSVFARISKDDPCPDTFADLLKQAFFPKSSFFACHTGFHPAVFEAFLSRVCESRRRPFRVVLEINLRSFSPQWFWHPSWLYSEEISLLSSSPGLLESKDVRYEDNSVSIPGSDLRRVGEFQAWIDRVPQNEQERRMRLRQIFLFHYSSLIEPTHPHLNSLRSLVNRIQVRGLSLYAFLTPVNYEAGSEYGGADFLSGVEANRRLLGDFFAADARGATVDDFSLLFDRSNFFSNDNATEHLKYKARRFLADQIGSRFVRPNEASYL